MQVFSYTADKEIRTDDLCLDVSRLNGPVIMLKCHHMRGNQLWEYDAEVPKVSGVARRVLPPLSLEFSRGRLRPYRRDRDLGDVMCHSVLPWGRLRIAQ